MLTIKKVLSFNQQLTRTIMAPLPTEEDMGYEDMDYGACHLERLLGASALSLIVEDNREGVYSSSTVSSRWVWDAL